MIYKSLIALSLLALSVSASPVPDEHPKNDADGKSTVKDWHAPPGGDDAILNFFLSLENLQIGLYTGGLAKYTSKDFVTAGFPETFYANLSQISHDKSTHVDSLEKALKKTKAEAAKPEKYTFSYKSAADFVTLASQLEGLGVSAYLGAAQAIEGQHVGLLANSILASTSRHSAYIRSQLHQWAFPAPFDTPLDFNLVYTVTSKFTAGTATTTTTTTKDSPFKAFQQLTVAPSTDKDGKFRAGGEITFTGAHKDLLAKKTINEKTAVYAAFYTGLHVYYEKVELVKDTDFVVKKIPGAQADKKDTSKRAESEFYKGPSGQVYVTLTTADGKKLKASDENTLAGVGVLEFYPEVKSSK